MKDFKFYCGIFATLFVATTATLLTSCSQEDDDYDTDMYTLAERMGTRANPGENTSSQNYDKIRGGSMTSEFDVGKIKCKLLFDLTWEEWRLYSASAKVKFLGVTGGDDSLTYTDDLGIQRKISRYKFIKCDTGNREAEIKVTNMECFFVLDGIIVYYSEAYIDSDGKLAYKDDAFTLVSLKASIPEEYIMRNQN